MEIKIAMAGLAHGHGVGFLESALKLNGVSVTGFFDNENLQSVLEASNKFNAPVYNDLDERLVYIGKTDSKKSRFANGHFIMLP